MIVKKSLTAYNGYMTSCGVSRRADGEVRIRELDRVY